MALLISSDDFTWFCNDKQPSPTYIAICGDACLECHVTFPAIDLVKYFTRGNFGACSKIKEIAVYVVWFKRLKSNHFTDIKVLHVAISINQADFLAGSKLIKPLSGKIIVCKQSYISCIGSHAILC